MTSAVATRGDEQTSLVFSTQAHVRAASESSDAELLALIKKKAPNPEVFDKITPFMLQAEASNSGLDSYFTRMDDKTLKNYAKDADAGVMLLDSHDKRQLGYGQSIRGTYEGAKQKIDEKEPDDKDKSRVLIDFYVMPGVKLGRGDSDSFILGVQSGIIRDVSIGFIPGSFECNLCRNDPFDWWAMECMHIPGAYYDSTGKNVVNVKSQGAILAFAWVRDGRLSEVSAVYDGATPGAYIQKAHYLVENGEVSRQAVTMLERQLRIKLPTVPVRIPSFEMKDGKLFLASGSATVDGKRVEAGMEVPMGAKPFRRLSQREEGEDSVADQVIAAIDEDEAAKAGGEDDGDAELSPDELATATVDGDDEPIVEQEPVAENSDPEEPRMKPEEISALQARVASSETLTRRVREAMARVGRADAETADPADVIEEMARSIADLTPRAKMGDEYREGVIKEALESGVRALDKDFDQAEYAEAFKLMSVKQIRMLGDGWERMVQNGDSKIPVGGRRTADIGTSAPAERKNGTNGTGDLSQYTVGR